MRDTVRRESRGKEEKEADRLKRGRGDWQI